MEPIITVSTFRAPRDWFRGVIFWSQISNPRHYMTVFIASQDTLVRRVWPGTARILKMHRSQTKMHHSHAQSVEHVPKAPCDKHQPTHIVLIVPCPWNLDNSFHWMLINMDLIPSRVTSIATCSRISVLDMYTQYSLRLESPMICVKELMSSLTVIHNGRLRGV